MYLQRRLEASDHERARLYRQVQAMGVHMNEMAAQLQGLGVENQRLTALAEQAIGQHRLQEQPGAFYHGMLAGGHQLGQVNGGPPETPPPQERWHHSPPPPYEYQDPNLHYQMPQGQRLQHQEWHPHGMRVDAPAFVPGQVYGGIVDGANQVGLGQQHQQQQIPEGHRQDLAHQPWQPPEGHVQEPPRERPQLHLPQVQHLQPHQAAQQVSHSSSLPPTSTVGGVGMGMAGRGPGGHGTTVVAGNCWGAPTQMPQEPEPDGQIGRDLLHQASAMSLAMGQRERQHQMAHPDESQHSSQSSWGQPFFAYQASAPPSLQVEEAGQAAPVQPRPQGAEGQEGTRTGRLIFGQGPTGPGPALRSIGRGLAIVARRAGQGSGPGGGASGGDGGGEGGGDGDGARGGGEAAVSAPHLRQALQLLQHREDVSSPRLSLISSASGGQESVPGTGRAGAGPNLICGPTPGGFSLDLMPNAATGQGSDPKRGTSRERTTTSNEPTGPTPTEEGKQLGAHLCSLNSQEQLAILGEDPLGFEISGQSSEEPLPAISFVPNLEEEDVQEEERSYLDPSKNGEVQKWRLANLKRTLSLPPASAKKGGGEGSGTGQSSGEKGSQGKGKERATDAVQMPGPTVIPPKKKKAKSPWSHKKGQGKKAQQLRAEEQRQQQQAGQGPSLGVQEQREPGPGLSIQQLAERELARFALHPHLRQGQVTPKKPGRTRSLSSYSHSAKYRAPEKGERRSERGSTVASTVASISSAVEVAAEATLRGVPIKPASSAQGGEPVDKAGEEGTRAQPTVAARLQLSALKVKKGAQMGSVHEKEKTPAGMTAPSAPLEAGPGTSMPKSKKKKKKSGSEATSLGAAAAASTTENPPGHRIGEANFRTPTSSEIGMDGVLEAARLSSALQGILTSLRAKTTREQAEAKQKAGRKRDSDGNLTA